MKTSQLKQPLISVLETYAHVEVVAFEALRRSLLAGATFHKNCNGEMLLQQLREAIDNQLITPEEFENLTGHPFDSQEELQEYLEEIWEEITYVESESDGSS